MHTKYRGELKDETVSFIGRLLELSDEQLAIWARTRQTPVSEGEHIKKYSLYFLEANIGRLHLIDPSISNQVLALQRRIEWMNEEIERCNFYFEKSFDESIGPDNRAIMDGNRTKAYGDIANLCRKSVDIASKIITGLRDP